MIDLFERLRSFLDRHSSSRYWIGYSGGLDSHVLLHLCARLKAESGLVFTALHVNHGLHSEADKWQAHCRRVCVLLKIPFESTRVDARPRPGESPEEAARNARYKAFCGLLQANEALLLAHHQDDQAETVLLQLLRGSGLAGLSGMGREAALGDGRLLRPLLDIPRETLLDYAHAHRLAWIEDPSNQTMDFDRNYLRHQVFPLLKRRWPACTRTLSRAAVHCAEADDLLDQWGKPILQSLIDEKGSLDLTVLDGHSRQAQRRLLRAWLKEQNRRPPAAVFVERILNEIIPARGDANPRVAWGDVEVRRYRRKLYALPRLQAADPAWHVVWSGKDPLHCPDGTKLEVIETQGKGIDSEKWLSARITVRYRRGGERCRLPGRQGRHSLKKLFQEQGVPPWERERMPLVYLDDELAAVGDLWVCAGFCVHPGSKGLILRWSKRWGSHLSAL